MDPNSTQPAPQKQKSSANDYLIRPLRTYEDDVASFVRDRKISTADMMLAEQKRRQRQSNEASIGLGDGPQKKSSLIKIGLSVFFVALGLGLIIFSFIQFNLGNKMIALITNKDLVVEDKIKNEAKYQILVNNKSSSKIMEEINKSIISIKEKDIKQITEIELLTTKNTETGEVVEAITTENFIKILGNLSPAELSRSLDKEFFLGVLNLKKPAPVILFKTNDFNLTYASMLRWENVMASEIGDIFTQIKKEDSENTKVQEIESGTESTSSVEEVSGIPTFDPRKFEDVVLLNKDVRAIINSKGEILFFYGFIDNQNLILTTEIDALREIIKRLNAQNLIR